MIFEDKVKNLLDVRPIPVSEIINEIALASKKKEFIDLKVLDWLSRFDDVYDEYLANPAIAFMAAWGLDGLNIIADRAFNGPHSASALCVLCAIAQGRCPDEEDTMFISARDCALLDYEVTNEVSKEALKLVRAGILDQIADLNGKKRFLWSLSFLSIPTEGQGLKTQLEFYIDLLVDSHLLINQSILNQFELLLQSNPRREEDIQSFLTQHPVLIDPFVTELRSKHQLGNDFITDYVIRRINNDYVLIEIEKSTDKIFTQDGNFTSTLTKATSQVRDFQAWVSENISYAQKKLPNIRRPEGMVIIGRSLDLNNIDRKRLEEENFSRRGHIRILTFDDLLDQAKAVYSNLLNKPIVLKSKDQQVI